MVISIIEIYYSIIAASYILAVLAAHYSFKNWIRWKEIEVDTVKARIFLDKSFLVNNFRLTFVAIGIMAGLTSTYLLVEYAGIKSDLTLPLRLNLVYFSVFPVALLSFVLVAYARMWHQLLYKDPKIH